MIVHNLLDDSFAVVKGPGRLIWDSLDGNTSVGDIIEKICEKFDVARETAEHDCKQFVEMLLNSDLVTKHV